MYLSKYTDEDFPILDKWVTSAELLFLFAGSNWTYPLTMEAIHDYQLANPEKQSYLLYNDENEAIAFGELISGGDHAPRLGRLLVGLENNRGKGYGKILIQQLIDESRKVNPQKFIHLFVLEDNYPARKCYENLGFQFDQGVNLPLLNADGVEFIAKRMTLFFEN